MNCPFCAEEIKDEASVCRYCGRDFLSVRPLLDANQALGKRIDALQEQISGLTETQTRLSRHLGLANTKVPSIHRGSAIALLLVWIFVAGLFIAAVKQHGGGYSLAYATSALIVVPLIFGFLCQNVKTHPSASDFVIALLATSIAVVEIQVIRWELIGGYLIPRGWDLGHTINDLPPDSWSALLLNAATIFLSFTTGVFIRYLLQARHHPQVTVATPVSKFIVARLGGQLTPAEIAEKIKRTDALIHSIVGIATGGGAVVTYFLSHVQ
jgi:hypothetical protein